MTSAVQDYFEAEQHTGEPCCSFVHPAGVLHEVEQVRYSHVHRVAGKQQEGDQLAEGFGAHFSFQDRSFVEEGGHVVVQVVVADVQERTRDDSLPLSSPDDRRRI